MRSSSLGPRVGRGRRCGHEVQHALPEDFVVVVVRLLLELAVHGAVGAGFLFHALQRPAAQERVDAVDVRVHAGELDQAGFEPDLEAFLQRTQTSRAHARSSER